MSLQLRPLLVVALIGCAAGAAFAETSSTAQIYLQRSADGRSVLTDRPSATAVTERTWQMEREDPAAAHQRALEVQRQADAVSLRVQHSIEAQERRSSEADLLRMRLAQLERRSEASSDEGDVGFAVPFGFGRFNNNRLDHHRPQHHSSHAPTHSSFRGSAALGSR